MAVVVIAITAIKSDDYLNKPVSLEELGLLVQRLAAASRRRVRIGPGKNRPRCRQPRPQQTRRWITIPAISGRCRDLALVLALLSAGSSIQRPSSPPPVQCPLTPPHRALVTCSATAASMRTSSTPRGTGCWSVSSPSRSRWPNAISPTARAAARSPSAAIAATAGRARSGSSLGDVLGLGEVVYGLLCAP